MKYFFTLILSTLIAQCFCDSDKNECSACHGSSVYRLSEEKEKELGKNINFWENKNRKKIVRTFKFTNQAHLLSFIDKIAKLAEEIGHHPDLQIKKNILICSLHTHALNALSEIDFSMAKKIDSEWEDLQKGDNLDTVLESIIDDPCALIDCSGARSLFNVIPNKAARQKLTVRDKEATELTSWITLKSLSSRIYRRFTFHSFMDAVNSTKDLIDIFYKNNYTDFEIYLYYTDLRIDLKKAINQDGSIKANAAKITQSINEALKL